MRSGTATRCLLVCACLMAGTVSQAQQQSQQETLPVGEDRLSVGLVLSGGGARGGAHIGVLRALEELRVPVDYIAGTSIGAAIGGFYASGMTIADLEKFVEELEWDEAFLSETPRELRSFRRKRDDDLFLVEQRPGFNDGELSLPLGAIQGQVIDTIMSRVMLPVAHVQDFDKLLIPFRAVAGDVVTGEAVVLDSGELPVAIRASMSVPAVMTPVEIDDRLLVDGGIAMNLPVEVVKAMGAERVIAIDITAELYEYDRLNSVVDVTAQLTTLLTRRNIVGQKELLTEQDILLEPSFSQEYSSVSFDRLAETIGIGYEIVMDNREKFSALALSEAEYAAYKDALEDPRGQELPIVEFVRLDNNSPIADSIIRDRLRGIELGVPFNVEQIETAVNKVYGLEYFQTVAYSLVEEEGRTGLEVSMTPRSWGPNYFQLGLQYSSAADDESLFGFAVSYLRTGINEHNGDFRGTFAVGDEPALIVDLHQPFGPAGRNFFAPALNYESELINVFDGENITSRLQVRELMLEFAAGRELGYWGEFRGGVRKAVGETKLRIGLPDSLEDDSFRRGEFFARFSVDTFDNIAFPRQGILATSEWRGARPNELNADADYDQLLLSTAHAKTWGNYTLLSRLRYDTTISGEAPVRNQFQFGGFFDLSGLSDDQFTAQTVARLSASVYRRIGDLSLFPAFAGFSLEYGGAWDGRSDISFNDSTLGGSLWAGVDTPIGPVYLGYGRTEGGRDAFYVFLGRIF